MNVVDYSGDPEIDDRRCLDIDDQPMCSPRDIEVMEAVLVERLADVTCPVCIAMSNVPRTRLQAPGRA